jgi:hypothetical protein
MTHDTVSVKSKVHRLIPSRYPTIDLFDWVESKEELEEVAKLEGFTNERLIAEIGEIQLVSKEDWVSGPGASVLMATFTHRGISRFSDGSYGIYYAADSLDTAIAETKYHRTRFLNASNEGPCLIQMREYTATVQKKLLSLSHKKYQPYLNPDPNQYIQSQEFAKQLRAKQEWGLHYPSVRKKGAYCAAIFRPPALTIPVQGCHLDYIWDGNSISEVRLSKPLA